MPIPPAPRLPVSNRAIAWVLLGIMTLMASIGGIYAWFTPYIRREHDAHLPRPSVIDIPLIARIALGGYVLVMVLAILRGWNRRERGTGTSRSILGQRGIPALALVVLLGVGLVLLAIQQRPVRNPTPNEPSSPDAVEAVLPSKLAALAYLPDDVHLLVGIHIAEAWHTPAGRSFLDGSRPGAGLGLDRLESVTGLKMTELDHAVLAIKLDRLLPRFFLIVRTIQPYNPDKILKTLDAKKLAGVDQRSLFEFTMQQSPFKAVLWFPDNQSLVIGWPGTDLKDVPSQPRSGLDHLPHDLRSVLKDRFDPAAIQAPVQLWFAGHVEDWKKLAASGLLALRFKEAWPFLSEIKTAAVWAHLNRDAIVRAVCRCTDPASAEALRDLLQPEEAGKGLAGLLPAESPLTVDLTKTLEMTRDGEEISLGARVNAATLQKAATPRK